MHYKSLKITFLIPFVLHEDVTSQKNPHSQITIFQISDAEIKATWKQKNAPYDGPAALLRILPHATQA